MIEELDEGIREHYPDVTHAQGRVMALLDREGTRMSVLADRAQMTKQSLTELVVGLEAAGLVRRVADPSDGRAKLVRPTAEGERAMKLGFEVAQRMHRRWTDLIGERDMASLMRTMGRLVKALTDERAADTT
jgi:DNA-binding MarR family transcriptional regulator